MPDLICSPDVSNFLKAQTALGARTALSAAKRVYDVNALSDLYQLTSADVSLNQIIGIRETDQYYIVKDLANLSSAKGYALCDRVYLPNNVYYDKLVAKKGTAAQLEASTLAEGEFAYTTDTKKLYFGSAKSDIESSTSSVNSFLTKSYLPDGYGRVVAALTTTSLAMSVTSSSGYVAYYTPSLGGTGTVVINASGSKVFTIAAAQTGQPKEIIFWPCVGSNDSTKSGNITAFSQTAAMAYVDVTRLGSLTSLSVGGPLTSLDMSGNPLLTSISVNSSLTLELDLSACPLVSTITFAAGVTILTLDNNVSASITISSSVYALKTLNIRNCVNLTSVNFAARYPELSAINVNSSTFANSAFSLVLNEGKFTPDWFYTFCTSLRALNASSSITFNVNSIPTIAPLIGPPVSPYFNNGQFYTADQVNAAWRGKIQPLFKIGSTTYTLT